MARRVLYLLALSLCLLAGFSSLLAARPLEIFFIDVEGGEATLIGSPGGQSLLIGAGYRGFNNRDTNRIIAAAKKAGVKQINGLLIPNYESDRVGGAYQLPNRLKMGTFFDHGPLGGNSKNERENFADYEKLTAGSERTSLKPGDQIPLKGLEINVLTSAGAHIQTSLPGAGRSNPACGTAKPDETAATSAEASASVGVLVSYGSFRFLDLGDLPGNAQRDLVCPVNLIGEADVYFTPANAGDAAGTSALVKAVRPRVIIVGNGPHKGSDPQMWQLLKSAPGSQDIWQLHYAFAAGADGNARDSFIANVDEFDQGDYLKLTVQSDGSFTLYNSRNKFQKAYPARPPQS